MIIKVQLKNPITSSETSFEFDQSPIRIGRSPLNNIVLEDNFVSQWHGMIRFDDTTVTYLDLGSTNGTVIEDVRAPKNVAVPLAGVMRLGIWSFRLVVTVCPTPASLPSHHSTQIMNAGVLRPVVPVTASAAPAVTPAGALPAIAPSSTNNPDRLARCLRILESFSEAFVALKKGYEEFGAEVGVRPLSGSTPLHHVHTGREVMDYLLGPKEVEECKSDLRAVFADMGIHQIALMEGITQGIRALLESLDPSMQEAQSGSGLFSRSRSKALWATYQERFTTLITEDTALHAEIFGEAFARAYASVALGATASSDLGHPDSR